MIHQLAIKPAIKATTATRFSKRDQDQLRCQARKQKTNVIVKGTKAIEYLVVRAKPNVIPNQTKICHLSLPFSNRINDQVYAGTDLLLAALDNSVGVAKNIAQIVQQGPVMQELQAIALENK